MPRSISFNLDSRDADVWTGQPLSINSDLTLRNVAPYDRFCMPVQVLSVGEAQDYQYQALEYTYSDALAEDEDSDDPNYRPVYISGQTIRLEDGQGNPQTLREAYDAVWPDLLSTYNVVFIFDLSCVAGSDDAAEYSVITSSGNQFSVLASPILLDVRGLIAGKGGEGGSSNGTNGGPAISLKDNIRLSNTGTIGGGGGGGGGYIDPEASQPQRGDGGGGAGFQGGFGGGSTQSGTVRAGTLLGGDASAFGGGDGGDLGQDGSDGNNGAGGSAGAAIDLNGYTITYINTGTILGSVS
jgi:hypothetical protein